MRRVLFILFLLGGTMYGRLHAQENIDHSLAMQYYQNEEYEKAADLFGKLYDKTPESSLYYRYLYNCLLSLEDYNGLEKVVKRNIKKHPEALNYLVDMGFLYAQRGDVSKGNGQYQDALKKLTPDQNQVIQLANAFTTYNEVNLAAETYERARQLFHDPTLYAMQLAAIYERGNQMGKAIDNYLLHVDANPNNVQSVKNRLQTAIQQDAAYEELQSRLLKRVQKSPNSMVFSDLLIWMYIQRKNFKMALIQTKALDRRLNENGLKVIEIGRSARQEQQFDVAAEAYQYVIDKGPANGMYMIARQELLTTRQEKIMFSPDPSQEDITALDTEYDNFLKEFGLRRNTASTLRDKARLKALYLGDYDEAISILEELIAFSQVDNRTRGEAKLDLGDYYLMKGDVWESSLLYSQVDKAFGDEPLGEMARYRNAKLSYYRGEFEWSQAQLNILKASTTELIANDALNLSVFITDNLGLDTILYPMEKFAKADLLFYQNKPDDALSTLDSISNIFPNHSLSDDILYMRYKIAMKQHKFEAAAGFLESIIKKYKEDILGDDATYQLAQLYDNQLNDKEKAAALYEQLIFNYKDSVYVVEARKRYRALRGDQL